MSRKPIFLLVFTIVLLALGLLLTAARGVNDAVRQTGMDMGTATPMPSGDMLQPTQQPHIVPLPAEYAPLTNTVPGDSASLSRGAALYQANCVQCHGASGLGDGMAAASLNPPVPAIAWTSQMLTDPYMFYRISEGGASEPFSSAMPAWKSTLSETDRWDLVNYIRTLSGSAQTQLNQSGGYGMMGGMGSGMMGSGTGMGSGCMMGSGTLTTTTGMNGGMGSMSGMGSMGTGCSMMSGGSMTTTAAMGSGMAGMNMDGMSMSGMSGSGMNMSGTNMTGMNMTSASTPAEVLDPPWYTNPWTVLGWALVGLLILLVSIGIVTGAILLVRRSRSSDHPAINT